MNYFFTFLFMILFHQSYGQISSNFYTLSDTIRENISLIYLTRYDTGYSFSDKNLKYVKEVDITQYKLNHYPRELCSIDSLEKIIICHSNLMEIPTCIGNYSKLYDLNLHNNQISLLPKELFNASKIERLILSFNSIKTVPNEINNLYKLIELDLTGNLIENWSFLKYTPNLKHFGMGYYNLKMLPEEINYLQNLKSLYLGYNPKIDQKKVLEFLVNSKLDSLESIDFEFCKLGNINTNLILQLKSLKTINLVGNRFSKRKQKQIKNTLKGCNLIFNSEPMKSPPYYL